MDAKATKVFRESFKGYNKDDVNSYIAEISATFAESEAEYRKVILSLNKQIDEWKEKYEGDPGLRDLLITQREENETLKLEKKALESQCASLSAKQEESSALINALNNRLDTLQEEGQKTSGELLRVQTENESMKIRLGVLQNEYDLMKTEAEQYHQACELLSAQVEEKNEEDKNAATSEREAKDEETASSSAVNVEVSVNVPPETISEEENRPEEAPEISDTNNKAQLYDKFSSQIGQMLIDAREAANEIIAKANAEADEIRQTARTEADELKTDSLKRYNETMNRLNASLKKMASDCITEYAIHMGCSRPSLDRYIDDVRRCSEEASDTVDKMIRDTAFHLNSCIDEGVLPSDKTDNALSADDKSEL